MRSTDIPTLTGRLKDRLVSNISCIKIFIEALFRINILDKV
ncbi:hypothetical protein BVRB_8g197300 [Beta vulgaris subsp. vulgaris]|nr:hypothetical protein BVRB_8g197300 [Beta vulgaris subsp. vulgaris]